MVFIYKCITLLAFVVLTTFCTKVEKGYKPEKNTFLEMSEMVNNHATLESFLVKFGSPSFSDYPKDDIICYASAEGQKIAFNRFYKPTYTFVCITFENKIAKSIKQKTLSSIKKQKMKKVDTNFYKPL